jgi:hypothetical protein
MREVKLFSFPKGIDCKIKFPKTNKFVDYITTKEVVFADTQILTELCTQEILAVSIRYHAALINRKYIKEWKVG